MLKNKANKFYKKNHAEDLTLDLQERLNRIFRNVLDDDINIAPEMSINDVDAGCFITYKADRGN